MYVCLYIQCKFKKPLQIHFIYLGNKKSYCNLSHNAQYDLLPTKAIYFTILSFSVQIILKFFTTHMLQFKYQPYHLKIKGMISQSSCHHNPTLCALPEIKRPPQRPHTMQQHTTQCDKHTHTPCSLHYLSEHLILQITIFWVCSDDSIDMVPANLGWLNLADINAKQTSFSHPLDGANMFICNITTYLSKQCKNPVGNYVSNICFENLKTCVST